MGLRYQTNTASGYNSSAPADDGSQTASNLTTWAGVKTKLGDPIKTLAEDINTDLVTAFDYSVRQITGSDSVAASDHMKTVEIAPTVSASVSVTLADAATMTSNFIVRIRNSSTIAQTITRATAGDTIDGTAGNISIPAKSSAIYTVNAAANGYLTLAQSAPTGDFPAGLTTAQTLTNKTLTSPVLNTGVSGTAVAAQADVDAGSSTSLILTPGRNRIALGTEQASTSGTSIDFTGIPAGVRRITVMFVGVSLNGSSDFLVQLGDAGGVEATGYTCESGVIIGAGVGQDTSTAGFVIRGGNAARTISGDLTLSLQDSSDFTWTASGIISNSAPATVMVGGSKALSAALDRVRITTVNGTDTFDAGAINISYER